MGQPQPYILIVDDNSDARRILTTMLTHGGYHTAAAAGGAEALAQIAQHKPALILLDIMMPGMSGFDMLLRMLCTPGMRHIPVIIMSAYLHDEHASTVDHLPGVVKIMPKGSFRLRQLLDAVKGAMKPARV